VLIDGDAAQRDEGWRRSKGSWFVQNHWS